jgi:aspartate-semialdehyde dehydrogenase
VGATGAVGETILSILDERDFPINNLYPLASANSAGKRVFCTVFHVFRFHPSIV